MILDLAIFLNLVLWIVVYFRYRAERREHRRFIRRMYDYHEKRSRENR